MTSFRDQSWDKRYEEMGDTAEGRFEDWCARNRLNFVRYGLDRPPIAMYKLPARIRYSPDYLLSNKFVEVQGFGRDQTVKLKLEKHGSLRWWNDVHPVDLYLWDSHNERECFVPIHVFDMVLGTDGAELRAFPEGKSYFALNADHLFAAAAERETR